MENTDNLNNENAPESGVLKSITKSNVFSVPENYFEKLPSAISGHIQANTHKPGLFSNSVVRWVSLTGMAVIILAAGMFYFNRSENTNPDPVLSSEQLVNSGELATIDDALLYEELQSRKVSDTEAEELALREGNEHFEEYLIENNTDINLIITEL